MSNTNSDRQRKLRDSKKPIRIWNTLEKHNLIAREAKKLKLHNSEFVNLCVDEHLKKCILSYDREILGNLEFQIRKIGNNINQNTYLNHVHGGVSHESLRALQKHVNGLEKFVRDAFMNPPELGAMLKDALVQHPTYRSIVEEILNQTEQ